jgi:hypothetical protein
MYQQSRIENHVVMLGESISKRPHDSVSIFLALSFHVHVIKLSTKAGMYFGIRRQC